MPGMNTPSKEQQRCCVDCNEKIIEGKFVEYPDNSNSFYHSQCFICANPNCKNDLRQTGVVALQNKNYCPSCYKQIMIQAQNKYLCRVCGTKLAGTIMVINDFSVCKSCFNCTQCKAPLTEKKFGLKRGLPVCSDCIDTDVQSEKQELVAVKCNKCSIE